MTKSPIDSIMRRLQDTDFREICNIQKRGILEDNLEENVEKVLGSLEVLKILAVTDKDLELMHIMDDIEPEDRIFFERYQMYLKREIVKDTLWARDVYKRRNENNGQ